MATLAVRTMKVRDLPQLRVVNQVVDRLDGPVHRFRSSKSIASRLQTVVPIGARSEHVFVATIDGELCAYLVAHRRPSPFQWELVEIAAGAPRLDSTYEVSVELWSALIGFAVKQAGLSGAKRIFAFAEDGSPAFESLRENGFEPFEDRFVLSGRISPGAASHRLENVRRQQDSDVWSVHQLYHQTTPRAVQFAEALTSAEWESTRESWFNRAVIGARDEVSFVLDTGNGVSGHCRIERKNGCALARLMLTPEYAPNVFEFLQTCTALAGVGERDRFQIDVPGYMLEYVSALERAGFEVSWQRVGLVKHTTAPVVVRPVLAPVQTAEERERAVHGVPTLYH